MASLTAALVAAAGLAAPLLGGEAVRPVGAMPHGRAFHGSCVLGNHLYVIGGRSYTPADPGKVLNDEELQTLCAPILAGGELGQWKTTTSLPQPRYYLGSSTVVLNDVVYLVGGTDKSRDGKRLTTILMNRAKPDGHLGEWIEVAKLPNDGLAFTSVFSTPGWLHMVGGVRSNRTLSPETWSVAVKPDGTLGGWREGPSLPVGIWFHHAGVSGGRVYVYGGLESYPEADVISAKVYAAPLTGDGRIGMWVPSSPLPRAFFSGEATSLGPYVMSFLGRYASGSKGENGDVWWSTTGAVGLTEWRSTATSVAPRRYHAVASDYRNFGFYLTGGMKAIGSGGLSNVYCFTLTPEARAFADRGWLGQSPAAEGEAASTASVGSASDADMPPGDFLPYQFATPYDANGGMRPMVLYFMAPKSRPSQSQNIQLRSPLVRDAAQRAVLASVDITANPQVAQQRGVIRVPTWLFFDSRGNLVDRKTGELTAQELVEQVNRLD